MTQHQESILLPIPEIARYLFFSPRSGADPSVALQTLSELVNGKDIVVGLGSSLVATLGCDMPGLKTFPAYAGPSIEISSNCCAVWCWLRGSDQGELVHLTRKVKKGLSPVFQLGRIIDAFLYGSGFDLSGYEDGIENPQGKVALVSTDDDHLAGGSFAAVQQLGA